MSQKELDVKIGEAWQAHYDGQHRTAIDRFKTIIEQVPDHIDANWGLGLSYRKSGDRENALKTFEKVRDLVMAELEGQPDDYERFFMLKRMVTQQIEQMSDFID